MMYADERKALMALDFNPAPTPDDVWRPSPYNVPELHEAAVSEILSGVNKARTNDDARPLGVALQGRSGSGKTHLLGAVRERIQREGGYFFLISLINGKSFWENTALCIVEGLGQDAVGWGTQLKTFLRRLTAHLGLSPEVRDAIAGRTELNRSHLDSFIRGLRAFNNEVGRDCQDTARALALLGSSNFEAQDVGYAHLISEQVEPAERAAWGLTPITHNSQQIVRDISRLIALTLSPTVIAIDQLDTLFAQTGTLLFERDSGIEANYAPLVGPVADGLLKLRDITQRTLTVVSCLPDTWALLSRSAASPVIERFRVTNLPDRITTPEIGRAIIQKRFTAAYESLHFPAQYPTWPVRPEAFDEAIDFTPRGLLRRVDQHIKQCLERDEITELKHLLDDGVPPGTPHTTRAPATDVNLRRLDEYFNDLVAGLDVSAALDPHTEDAHVPDLLTAGLASWIDEQAPTGRTYKHDPPPTRKPALHARLIEVLDEVTENEAHWAFRAISHSNAISAQSRVKAACTMAGLDPDVPQRRLVLLRNSPWPNGKRMKEMTDEFAAAGGIVHSLSVSDLKVFAALQQMRATPDAHLQEWLVARRPASGTQLLRDILGDRSYAATPNDSSAKAEAVQDLNLTELKPEPVATYSGPTIAIGRAIEGGTPLTVPLESLRKHTAIFAGSGSGKTVLIRRLVEECALQGVSAIVLDPNNDLARLGDAWPERPANWSADDAQRAHEYLANTNVIVWTPRREAGRPLAFQPLPDFRTVLNDPDELHIAIDSAVATLAPRAKVDGNTAKAALGQAVLREALMSFARQGGTGLRAFIGVLSALPDGVSQLGKAEKIAADMAETLTAAVVNDPLFGGTGHPIDPGVLLTPPPGKRARISVISLVGLPSDEQRQSFVNQLQMALFAWVKRNPAGDRPLGGLFVMDEAQTLAPSGAMTACTQSTLALASQARKYGLGLVFATQAPKALHNRIPGNAATQFFGFLNSPTQIEAAKEMARAKGSGVIDISRLTTGQFYATGEGFTFQKVQTPMCLSYHPKSPLTTEEVIERAQRKAP